MRGNKLSLEGFEQNADDDGDMNEKSDENKNENKNENVSDKEPSQTPLSEKKKMPTTSSSLMENLQEQAIDLQNTQKNIISGFQKIEPYMDRAESLLESIQKTAENIKGLKNSQTA